jgi:CDP-alcohol phosphatidyltransferase-like enzyme
LDVVAGYGAGMSRQPHVWIASRGVIERTRESRKFADDILAELAARHYGPSAWVRFIGRSLARSADAVRERPIAAAELTAIHLVAAAAGSWRWALTSWFLCVTHLGLLGKSSSLGWPNRLTVLRALLPSLAPRSRPVSVVALATDFADGRLARAGGDSAFGAFADPIADGVFWSWYALRWERNRILRWVPITLFGGSAGLIALAYFARGRTIDYPRPMAARYLSAVLQIMIAARTLRGVVR